MRDAHADWVLKLQKQKQDYVTKFKRSNDAVLTVYTPEEFMGYGYLACSADHGIRGKLLLFYSYGKAKLTLISVV